LQLLSVLGGLGITPGTKVSNKSFWRVQVGSFKVVNPAGYYSLWGLLI